MQAFEGVCIARSNRSFNSTFTVRKISHGEGVERVFPLFSANIDKIEVIRKGNVKRAKLYYLRDRTGKSARIADRDRGDEVDQYAMTEEEVISEDSSKETSIETNQTETIEQNTEPKTKEEQIKKEASEQPVHEEKKEDAQKESVKSEVPAEETEKKTDEQSK
mgnify:FL=1